MNVPNVSRRALILSALAILAPVSSCAGAKARQDAPAASVFTDGERDAVRLFWNGENRYTVLPVPTAPKRVNVTVAGSQWYWEFLRIAPPDPTRADWWKRKYAYEKAKAFETVPRPPAPGTPPPGVTPPPALFEIVSPTRYTVSFDPEKPPFVYEDALDFGSRPAYYAYYRSTTGFASSARRSRTRPVRSVNDSTPFSTRQGVLRSSGAFSRRCRSTKAVSTLSTRMTRATSPSASFSSSPRLTEPVRSRRCYRSTNQTTPTVSKPISTVRN